MRPPSVPPGAVRAIFPRIGVCVEAECIQRKPEVKSQASHPPIQPETQPGTRLGPSIFSIPSTQKLALTLLGIVGLVVADTLGAQIRSSTYTCSFPL